MIVFRLNTHSGIPAYLQIVQQVKQALQMGVLDKGDQLPTVKEVVGMIAINPNTVARAYRELESEGWVEGRAGIGTFVVKLPSGPPVQTQTELAGELADWVKRAKSKGLNDEAIEALIRVTLTKRGKHE